MIEQAVVLCGERGAGSRPPTAGLPTPLLPVGGAPFLDTLLFELGRHGFRRIVLLAGVAAARFEEYAAVTPLRARFGLDIDVAIVREPTEHGRCALAGARPARRSVPAHGRHLLVRHQSARAARRAGRGSGRAGGIGAAPRQRPLAKWSLDLGAARLAGDRVAEFAAYAARPGPDLIGGGVYALRRDTVAFLRSRQSLDADLFPRLAAEGRLRGIVFDGDFVDIACAEDLARARRRDTRASHGRQRFSTATAC